MDTTMTIDTEIPEIQPFLLKHKNVTYFPWLCLILLHEKAQLDLL